MKLSVIVPVYNTAKYLSRCIDSILHQSYEDFEVLLIDDGSMDGSSDICDQYAKRDARVRVIHKENGGLASVRVAGIRASRGTYIGFVDSDDWIESDMYEILMKPLVENSDIGISVGGHVVDGRDGRTFCPLKNSCSMKYTVWKAMEEMFLGEKFIWSLWDKVYKKKLLDNDWLLSHWPESYGEDTFVNAHVFPKALSIAFQPVYSYHYCMHEASMMHQKFTQKNLIYFSIWDDLIRKYKAKHYPIAYNIWKIMQSYSINVLAEMHRRYAEFQGELSILQQLLARNVKIFELHEKTNGQDLFYILMKSHADFLQWKINMSDNICAFFRQNGQEGCYIYGAGVIAERLTKFLYEYDIPFDGYVVSDSHMGKNIVFKEKVIELSDLIGKKCCFLLALNEKHTIEVIPLLQQHRMKYFLGYNISFANFQL